MSKSGMRIGAVAIGAAATLGVAGVSAGAATPSTSPASLSSIQAKAAAAITLRVNDLNAAIAKVNAKTGVGSGAAALDAYLQNDIAPLQQLGQKIAGDTTVATALADYQTIFTNFRVLALVLPAAQLAGRSDAIVNTVIPAFTADSAKAASHVNSSNQGQLEPLITNLNAQINAATTATSGLATTVLGYTPTGWNANHDLLAPSRGSVQAAVGNVTKARSDLQQIRAILKSSAAGTTTTTAA